MEGDPNDDGDEENDEPFSSEDDQDQDADQEDNIARFVVAEDYQQLLTKCLSALDLKDKQLQEGTTGTYRHPKNTLWGSRDYFPIWSLVEKVFPFPIFFEQQLRTEWEAPATPRRSLASVRKPYSLPKFTDDFLKVSVVDAPVLAIQSTGLFTEDGQGTIKAVWDRKIE